MRAFTFVLLVVCLLSAPLAADETLFSSGLESGGFGAPVVKITTVNGKAAFLTGGRGAWVINRSFCLGAGFYSTMNNVPAKEPWPLYGDNRLDLMYGGFEFEYVHASQSMLHCTASLLIGGGMVAITNGDLNGEMQHPDRIEDGIFVVEPTVGGEVNLTGWFRVGLGVGYRAVMDLQLNGYESKDFSGPVGTLTLKFGGKM